MRDKKRRLRPRLLSMAFLRSPNGHLSIFGFGMLAFATGTFFVLPSVFATTYTGVATVDAANVEALQTPQNPKVAHRATPEAVKAIYMTQCAVGTPSLRDSLVKLIEDTELNAVVIDIKDYTGYISFQTENPALKEVVSKACRANDMSAFIKSLHAHDIYVIGRITVFQDPHYTALHPEESVQSVSRPGEPWKDNKGLSFVSVASH